MDKHSSGRGQRAQCPACGKHMSGKHDLCHECRSANSSGRTVYVTDDLDVIEVIPESESNTSQEKSRSHSKPHKTHHRSGHKSTSGEAHQEDRRSRRHKERPAAGGGGYSSTATSGYQAGAYASRQAQYDSQENEQQRQQRIQQGYNYVWPSGYNQMYGQGSFGGPSQGGPSFPEARQTPAGGSGGAFHYVYDGTEGPEGERIGSSVASDRMGDVPQGQIEWKSEPHSG